MAYALLSRPGGHPVLVEMTDSEIKRSEGLQGLSIKKVDGGTAHDWVRKGRIHETALWIDDQGRIRKAQENN